MHTDMEVVKKAGSSALTTYVNYYTPRINLLYCNPLAFARFVDFR